MANTRDLIGEQATLDGLINHTLTSIEEDGAGSLGSYAVAGNTALTSVSFPGAASIGDNAFRNCTELLSANLPAAVTINQSCFINCKKLTGFEAPATVSSIPSNCFNGCSAMTWLKLPKTSMVTLANVNAFTGTLFVMGLGAIYVPSNLVATYKADNNWQNFFIASIDDYPLTDFSTITDSWSTILANEANGTYNTVYSIGDTKKAVINGNDVYMQIAAFDADALTGGGTAKITWVARYITETHKMNETKTNADGWAVSGMRTWLQSTVYDGLDSSLKTAIKAVDKTYYDKTSNSTKTASDTLWIPSWREVGASTSDGSCESSGPIYSGFFTNNTSRIKYDTSINTQTWWLRSAHYNSTGNFTSLNTSGIAGNSNANISYGVVFGFCT